MLHSLTWDQKGLITVDEALIYQYTPKTLSKLRSAKGGLASKMVKAKGINFVDNDLERKYSKYIRLKVLEHR